MTQTHTDPTHTDPPSSDQTIGTVVAGRFRVQRLLGRGGMSSVYEAIDETLGRTVAVKLFRTESAEGDELLRQQDEIRSLAGFNHPALVTLFDAGVDGDGRGYIVMECVSGPTLRDRLMAGPLPAEDVAQIGAHVADALAEVHTRGIVHRDVKPANILLPEASDRVVGPRAKLADFGIARIVDGSRLTATGLILGTAGYLAPEQALGQSVTPASDIYSLGLVLLESLTARQAFPGPAAEAMQARIARDPEIPESLGGEWVALLTAMTRRDVQARPGAAEVSSRLASMIALTGTRTPNGPVVAGTAGVAAVADSNTDDLGSAQTSPQPGAQIDSPTPAPTQALTPVPEAEAHPAAESARTQRRSPWQAWVLAAVVAVAGAGIVMAVVNSAPEQPTIVEPAYPAVDGELGRHLEQLQRSVEQ